MIPELPELDAAQEALRASRDALQAILQTVADGVLVQDPSGAIVYANDAAARMSGYPSAAALLAAPLADVLDRFQLSTESGEPVRREQLPAQRAFRGEPAPAAVLHGRALDTGEESWSTVQARPIRDAQGAIQLVVSAFQDVTALKLAERREQFLNQAGALLAESLDYDTTLARVAQLAVPHLADWAIVDLLEAGGRIRRVSIAHADPARTAAAWDFVQRFPPNPDAAHGVPSVIRTGISAFYPQISPALVEHAPLDSDLRRILQVLQPTSCVIVPLQTRGRTLGAVTFIYAESKRRYRAADLALAQNLAGRAALAVDNARLYRDAQEAARREQANAQQVSEREARSRALAEALQESEERLQLAARAAGFGTYDDRGPDHVYWSPELLAIFGLPADMRPREGVTKALELIHPDDRECWLTALRAAHDPAGAGVMDVEHRVIRPDGRTVWLAQKGRVFFSGEGAERRAVRAIGLVADITPRVEAELALRETAAARDRALDEARSALQVRDEFLASVSHDLRTPLTTIHGLTQVALRRLRRMGSSESEQLAAVLADAERASAKMAVMINELLDLSRLQSGRPLDLNRQPLDLVALTRQLVQEQQGGAAAHKLHLESAVPEITGAWDAVRLERVLANLLSNAIKYSPNGGRILVHLDARLDEDRGPAGDGGWAVVTVHDEGIGIPAAELPLIFERSHRGSNVPGSVGGMGIGLAGARQIVEQHGGTLTAASEEGRGSRFTMRLPRGSETVAGQ